MRDQSRDRRDRIVRGLARLSLISVLALMGAVFIGSAASAGGAPSEEGTSVVAVQKAEPQEGILDGVSPLGLLIGVVVIGSGFVVLTVGAFKPPTPERERQVVELLRD